MTCVSTTLCKPSSLRFSFKLYVFSSLRLLREGTQRPDYVIKIDSFILINKGSSNKKTDFMDPYEFMILFNIDEILRETRFKVGI